MAQNPNLAALSAAGVSVWLDDLSRDRLQTGNLQELIDTKSVVGVTTNPSIFQAALSKGTAYDKQVAELAERGADVDATIRTVTTDDVRSACDVLTREWEASDGVDGRVSIEVDPRLANDTDKTIRLSNMKVEFLGPNREHIEATPAKEVRYLQGPHQPNVISGPAGKVKVLKVPAWAQPKVQYGICVISASANKADAEAFVNKVLSRAGQRKLLAAGFLPRVKPKR